MDTLVVASNQADALAVDEIRSAHVELTVALHRHVTAFVDEIRRGDAQRVQAAHHALVGFGAGRLVSHLDLVAGCILSCARSVAQARPLVDAISSQRERVTELVTTITDEQDPFLAIGSAHALAALTEAALGALDEQLLPVLASSPDVPLAQCTQALRAPADPAPAPSGASCGCGDHGGTAPAHEVQPAPSGGGTCGCGGAHETGVPVLDARAVPHAIRHATIFGALDAVQPGAAMDLIAPHDPVPLLRQVEQRQPGRFEVTYLERGPEAWRLRFARG